MQKPANTKVLWSFNGVYTPKDDLVTLIRTFKDSGAVNVEVQIISSVSTLTPLRQQVTVYHGATYVDLTFSKELEEYNTGTEEWMMSFEGKYWNYINTRFTLRERGIADRVFVRGRQGKPTRLSVIVCNTRTTQGHPTLDASKIALEIANALEKEKPLLKDFEGKGIHVEHARITAGDGGEGDKGGKKEHAWVYILLVMVVLGAVCGLTYYRYRRKGTLLCFYPHHDNLNTQLVDDDDDDYNVDNGTDPNIVYRDL